MAIEFQEIPKNHPSYHPEKRLFRFHSGGTIGEAMKNVFEVSDMKSVEKIIRSRDIPFKELTIKPYGYDERIDWLTYLILADGFPVGYTNHSLLDSSQISTLEALPEPIKKISYYHLQSINHILTYIGFMNYCIDEIEAGTSTYEKLWDEEGGREEVGCMWYIYSRNASTKESVEEIKDDIKRQYEELMVLCGTKTWEDTKLVLSKVSNFNLKGLRFNYGE